MSLKHKVRINLACVALNQKSTAGFYKILITNKNREMPSSLIYGDKEIEDVIDSIVSKHIRVNSDWVNYRLVNIDRKKILDSQ